MIEIDGESQARDRDQLEGERLRAEFNSPLTRDAQRFLGRRFKRASDAPVQVGMFEAPPEEPPQGRLF